MRVCPTCRTRYPTRERFCTADQSILVEQADLDRIGTQVGNYHLCKIIGRGGMGTVYSAEHVYIGKPVAVKILHQRFARYEEAINRFLREARAASSIMHPNIVDVTDFGPLPSGGVFFVMEYLAGASLEDVIERRGPIELHRALNIANQMALALAAAHDKGIVHRDLKPENVMLIRKPGRRDLVRAVEPSADAQGTPTPQFVVEREAEYDFVKVLDFGIAKVMTIGESREGSTLQGAVFGTPEYMSPEAARGDEVDHRADVYSLGVILFDMLTGHPPFEAEAAAEVLAMQISRPTPSPREINPKVEITEAAERVIVRAMAKAPEDRYQSMDELRADLQRSFGSVAYRRNATHIEGVSAVGIEGRNRRLTDELGEWLTSGEQLPMDEARMLAMINAAQKAFTHRPDTGAGASEEDEETLADAIDRALDD